MRWLEGLGAAVVPVCSCQLCHLSPLSVWSWKLMPSKLCRELQLMRDACWEWERVRNPAEEVPCWLSVTRCSHQAFDKVLDSGLLPIFGWGGLWAQGSTLRTVNDRAALLFARTGFLEHPAASSAARWQWFPENPVGSLFMSLSCQFPQERKLSGFQKDLPIEFLDERHQDRIASIL